MEDLELIDYTLDKIARFGNGELEFETKDIERICILALKKVKLFTIRDIRACCLCGADFTPSIQLPNDATCNRCHKELRGY